MDNDEEGFINFEVTSNDLDFESDPLSSFRRQTKDEAIYGIWSVDDDRARGKKDTKSYYKSMGMQFVSGGVTQNEPKNEQEKADENISGDEDDAITDSDVDDDDFRPSTSKSSINNQQANRSSEPSGSAFNRREGERPSFGAVNSTAAYRASREFGTWEQYTRGIGYKLLDKMGYIPGKGLGRSNQGIVNPVAAKKRKGKAGVGAMGPEREQEEEDFATDSKVANKSTDGSSQKRQWRKSKPGEKRAKVNYTFVTVEDLRKQAASTKSVNFSALGNVKVIDRTGPETKYLHGYDELARQYKRPSSEDEAGLSDGENAPRTGFGSKIPSIFGTSGFKMPELIHNINKIVSSLEQQIVKADQTALRGEDKIAHLKYEEDRLSKQFNEEEEEIARLSDLKDRIQEIRSRDEYGDDLTFEEVTEKFANLKRQFANEFLLYDLHNLTVALVFPKVKLRILNWDLSSKSVDKLGPVQEYRVWKDLLKGNRESENVYAHMIWDFWMPKIRRYIMSISIRSSEILIEVLEAWSPILPTNIYLNLVEQFIMPRLQQALDEWNPVSDVVPVHSWIHPWLPLLGDRLQPLYVTIRTKLAHCLVNWDPTDRSAKLIIEPWRDVFTAGEMEAFLIKAICPKLKMALHLMPLDNTNSGIEILRSVLIWHDLLSMHQLSQILVTHFFPKWMAALCAWLSNSPDYEQVEKWYRAWRNEFPVSVLAGSEIKASFKQAMDIMTRAISGSSVAGLQYVSPALDHPQRTLDGMGGGLVNPQLQYGYNYNSGASATPVDTYVPQSILRAHKQSFEYGSSNPVMQLDTFRDLVERRCSELNLVFAPVPGVFHDSKQVYTLGTVKVCIDKGVLFVNKGGGGTKWQPMALPAVLSYAKGK